MHQPMTAQVVGGPLPRYEIYYAEDEGKNKFMSHTLREPLEVCILKGLGAMCLCTCL